jgi:hypothetical protein
MAKRTAANHKALSSTETKPKRRKGGKKAAMGAEPVYNVVFAAMKICPDGQYTLLHS